MKLSEKGAFAPPPKLKTHARTVANAVAAMKGVVARTHWQFGDESVVDGADFYFGEEELGHIHLDSEAHVFHSVRVASALIASGHGQPSPWSRNIVVFRIGGRADVNHALWLFRLSYDRRRGVSEKDLLARARASAALHA